MPFALMAFGAAGFGWLIQPERRIWGEAWAAGGTSLALVVGLALAVDPPSAGHLTIEID